METITKINLQEPIIAVLATVWSQFPELRLGQLIQNAMDCGEGMSDLYDRSDGLLTKNLAHYLEEYGKDRYDLPTGLLSIHEKRKVSV